jgi:protein-S-isoprenylcysteine O-methyltransferase Ste14
MIVIRRDNKDSGEDKKSRSFKPFIWILVIFALLFLLIPIGVTMLLNLPWYLSFIYPYGTIIGVILIISGIVIVYRGIKDLRLKYSQTGYEKGDSLVTTGIYARTRNPIYFGATIMVFGWFLVLPFTFILISAFLFTILFLITAKSEEKQLSQKYGRKYRTYKRKVPFFVPYKIR